MLAYITGLVDRELLLQTEYLAAENRILRAQLKGRLRLSDAERATLGEIGHRLGRKALAEVANAALPDTILGWYRKLVARKFDGSKARRRAGRPRTGPELERLIVKMARENPGWGMIELSVPWPISAMRFPTRASVIFLNATGCPPHQSANTPPAGQTSFVPTWQC